MRQQLSGYPRFTLTSYFPKRNFSARSEKGAGGAFWRCVGKKCRPGMKSPAGRMRMNTDTGARQELASAPAVLSERHPACSDPVKLRMTRTIGTRAMRPLARWVLGIVVTGMLLGPEAVRADGSLQIPVAGDASLNGMVWTGRRDNGFVWSGSFPFTFHALADVNGDGFADLIYTVRPIHFRLILPVPRPLTSMSSIPTVPASVPRWWWRPTPVPRSGCAAALVLII